MTRLRELRDALVHESIPPAQRKGVYFKTAPGEYAAHDRFMGIPVPTLRRFAKTYQQLSLKETTELLYSPMNEERLLALFILILQYEKATLFDKKVIYDLYTQHIAQVNNWNLVDSSAHLIIGAHLHHRDKTPLIDWATAESLWERRIAIVATWYFIRQNEFEWTIKISELLLKDKQDLIHKAVGWMLREAGKRDAQTLKEFLNIHAEHMPRTMLRYAIEKLSSVEKEIYLDIKLIT